MNRPADRTLTRMATRERVYWLLYDLNQGVELAHGVERRLSTRDPRSQGAAAICCCP
jgi:hypothetical protein